MKKIFLCLSVLFVFGCQNSEIEKPKNLIERSKMEDILLDISLIEAVKTQNIQGGISLKEGNNYIYKKYNIDSIQLTKSNKYYASDVTEYRLMYQRIKERLEQENRNLNGETASDSVRSNSQNANSEIVN